MRTWQEHGPHAGVVHHHEECIAEPADNVRVEEELEMCAPHPLH